MNSQSDNNSLVVNGLNQYYGDSHILRDLNLFVKPGACTCLMGRNGVGKTTLLKAAMGLIPVRSGSIQYDGAELIEMKAEMRALLGVGYVPQGRQIFPLLTVEENLRTGLRSSGETIPDEIYETFPVLFEMRRRRGGDLSGGQQQQLAIGRALVLDPGLLILDEPTEGIQPNIVSEIGSIIRLLVKKKGLTVLLVEQKLPFARRVADAFSIMVRGTCVAQGTIDELDDELVARHLNV